jgi:hypothetical protein
MRHMLKAVFLPLMLVCATGAQEPAHQTPSLTVGPVTLNLGLTHERVFQQLKEVGYKAMELPPLKGDSSQFLVVKQDTPELGAAAHSKGLLFFKGDSLVRILAHLGWDFQTDRELALSLYSIIRKYEEEVSNNACSLRAADDARGISAGVEAKQIEITCNLSDGIFRTTTLQWSTFEGSQHQPSVSVTQVLWR